MNYSLILCAVSNALIPHIAALYSQVTLMAAILALVVIAIMSTIILIAVWKKVRRPQRQP